MSLFSNATITRFLEQGEDAFNAEYPTILERVALDIVAGEAEYTLPEYVLNIQRITWLGWKIDPLDHRTVRELNLTGQEAGASRPYNYIFNNLGQSVIKFTPPPADTINSITTNLWGSEIPNRVIVEYWRASDHATYLIPLFIRTPLLNAYKLSKLYAIEGRGQDLKAAKYYAKQYFALKEKYIDLLIFLQQGPGRTIFGSKGSEPRSLSVHLPISRFGIGVNQGE